MSACHSIRSHSPLKSVFGKIGDTYQSYCNSYKTHAMVTWHGGIGHPLDRDVDLNKENPQNAETEIETHMTLRLQLLYMKQGRLDTLKVLSITHIQN